MCFYFIGKQWECVKIADFGNIRKGNVNESGDIIDFGGG